MNARLGLSVAALLFVSACSTPGGPFGGPFGPPPSAAFRPADFAWSTQPGSARIEGQLRYAPGGRRHSCASTGVILTPETPWVRQRMAILYGPGDRAALPATEVRRRTPPEANQDYSRFVRRAACDASGRFTFTGLPPGPWYIITAARPVGGGPDIAIMRRVLTRSGTVRVEM